MNVPSDGPNPLRPYYIPPSIGPGKSVHSAAAAASAANITSFGNCARDILSEFDYSEYLGDSSPSVLDSVKQLLETTTWRYSQVLISQPFEVAKTILQVYVPPLERIEASRETDSRYRQDRNYREDSSYLSDDEDSYFTSAAPATVSPSSPSRSRRPGPRITDRAGYIVQGSQQPSYMLRIKDPSSLLDVLSQLWSTSGPASMWKASNSTFIYSILLPTLNTFMRSLLSAIVGYPEDALSSSDILTSSSPGTTILLSCISSALSSIILSPIDTARTCLILSPQGQGPRSLPRAIRLLPTPNYLISPHLLPITIITSTLPSLLVKSTPLFLKSYLSLDPVVNPSSWSLFTLMSSGLEIALRIPLETVLRRAQIATFTSPILRQQSLAPSSSALPSSTSPMKSTTRTVGLEPSISINTIVPTTQSYPGIVATMWNIVYEEGTNTSVPESEEVEHALGHPLKMDAAAARRLQQRRKGQGIQGLYRSWRLEMWGIVGIWGSQFLGALMGGGADELVSDSVGRMALATPSGGSSGGF
ncbi:mitochondrial fusion and transport protein ugo1 [Myotisia sp. PD_48]|nr:mitochondrial fusion and transport protein ugo1 [Myotisia sp. PD_48]